MIAERLSAMTEAALARVEGAARDGGPRPGAAESERNG